MQFTKHSIFVTALFLITVILTVIISGFTSTDYAEAGEGDPFPPPVVPPDTTTTSPMLGSAADPGQFDLAITSILIVLQTGV